MKVDIAFVFDVQRREHLLVEQHSVEADPACEKQTPQVDNVAGMQLGRVPFLQGQLKMYLFHSHFIPPLHVCKMRKTIGDLLDIQHCCQDIF